MSNNLRTRNGLPFNFVDGLAIGGVPLESIVAGSASGVSFATNAETQAGTVTDKVISPSNLASVTSGLSQISHTHSQYAPLASPSLTGVPLAPTATAGTSTTQIATTAFVQAATIAAGAVPDASTTVAGKIMIASAGDTTSTDKAITPAILASGLGSKANTSHSHDISNVSGLQAALDGKVTNTDVVNKLREFGVGDMAKIITDWNAIVGSGWYQANEFAANAPIANWCIGTVIVHNGEWQTQEVWGFSSNDDSGDTGTWRREKNLNVWSAWHRVYKTAGEIASTIPDASTTVAGKVELATVTETITGTDFNKAVTPAAVQSHMLANSLGWNQQWSDFTGSRTIDILYQNTTGKPIQIAVTFGGPDGHVWIGPTPGSLMEITGTTTSGTGSGSRPVHSLIIPNLQYYKATNSGIDKWFELR